MSRFLLNRRTFMASTAAAALLAPFAKVGFAADEPVRGGSLTINIGAEPPSLIPVTNTGAAITTGPKVIEGLLTYDLDFRPQPQLATEWTISPDGKTYRFKLREGVKWHDGKDFTADDVVFSIATLREVHPRGRATFANVAEVKALSPTEVELVLSQPAPYLLKALAALETPILPKHLWEGTDPLKSEQLQAPVGTGPFVFKEWVRGSHVRLERNPNYWDAGKPYLDQIVFRFIADASSAVAALETGEVQLSVGGIPLNEVERLTQGGTIGVDTRGQGYINATLRAELNLDNQYLAKHEVREAIAHVIDRDFIVNAVYFGRARPIYGPLNPDVKDYFVADLPRYDVDPKKAEALLDAAGFPRREGGIRFALTIDPHLATGPYKGTADYIAQALKQVGIDASVRTQEWAAWVKRVYTDRAFDIAIVGISNLFDPTVGIQRLYWSKNFKPGVPFSNAPHYENAEVDRLLEAAAVEVDEKKRYELFAAFQRQVVADLPTIDLVAPDAFTVYRTNVHNHTIGADGTSSNGADIYLSA
jgi:peptide/nickel transport system substrate-binding protein